MYTLVHYWMQTDVSMCTKLTIVATVFGKKIKNHEVKVNRWLKLISAYYTCNKK